MKSFTLFRSLLMIFLMIPPVLHAEFSLQEHLEAAEKRNQSEVFYNLGIYYLGRGETGEASYYLHKAYLLNPDLPEIKKAYKDLRNRFQIEPERRNIFETVIFFPFTVFSLRVSWLVGFLMFSVGLLGMSAAMFKPMIRLQEKAGDKFFSNFKVISLIMISVGLIYMSSAWIRFRMITDSERAVVMKDCVLYQAPDSEAGKLSEIDEGLSCMVKQDLYGFFYIRTVDGRNGWVKSECVRHLWDHL